MTLNEIFDHGKDAAKHLFDTQGEVHPMWIIENNKGEITPMIVPMVGDKNEIAKAVGKALKELKAVRYVSIIEAWTLEPKSKELPESIKLGAPVSQHPDRREVIWIIAEEKGGSIAGMYYILRPEKGKPVLSPFKTLPKSEHQEGRFVNLLAS